MSRTSTAMQEKKLSYAPGSESEKFHLFHPS